MTWTPTDAFLRGKIVKAFLPFDKHPNLVNDNLRNLYPGDEVYIFETKDNKWARGYAISKPFPHDFVMTSVNLDDLPSDNCNVVVFPLKYVKVQQVVPFPEVKIEAVSPQKSLHVVPSISEIERAEKGPEEESREIPKLPNDFGSKNVGNLIEEIGYSLELMNSHLFALYSIGEFRLFTRLVALFHELHQTKIKLSNNLLSTNEAIYAKEQATHLLNKIPKKLASRAARLNEKSYDLDNRDTDISGYKSILARETLSGEILSLDGTIPARIALNSELGALVGNYPIHAHLNQADYDLKSQGNKKLLREPNICSHILVDFQQVSGSSAYQPPGFAGMTAYMYLRNSTKRLTEAFAVQTNTVDDLVDIEKLSAALFLNLPITEIDNNRIYLVAVLTEEIDITMKLPSHQSQYLKRVKKGIAVGVADITRVFSSNEGALASGESHRFAISLYASSIKYNNNNEILDVEGNDGWGGLADRIISNSSIGVFVNPRAEKLIVTVKEFKNQLGNGYNNHREVHTGPISRIKPIFFDPLAENYERIYLNMGKLSLIHNPMRDDLLTIEVSAPNNELIAFAKGSNQQEKRTWQLVSVNPEESIGEIVKVNGISLQNPSKKLPKEDFLLLTLYVNGALAGQGKLLYKAGNKLVEFHKRAIDIKSLNNKVVIGRVEVSTEYIGKIYNSDISIDNIFQYQSLISQGPSGIDVLSQSMENFCKLGVSQLVKYFPELLSSFHGIVDCVLNNENMENKETFLDLMFRSTIHLMDVLFGKKEQYLQLIENYSIKYRSPPQVGIFYLSTIAKVFHKVDVEWNAVSRAMCRVISYIMRLAIVSMKGVTDQQEEYYKSLGMLFMGVAKFLAVPTPNLAEDQILIMNIVDYVLSFRSSMDPVRIIISIVGFLDAIGTRGLGANEESYGQTQVIKGSKGHEVIIGKLLLNNRLLHSKYIDNHKEVRRLLVSNSVRWAFEVLTGATDIDASRLACTNLNTVCTILWEKVLPSKDPEDIQMCYSLTKFLPVLASVFSKYNTYLRTNDQFKPKRTFTNLFPTQYPFREFSIDSIVNDEVMVELLVEIATCFSFMGMIGKNAAGEEGILRLLEFEIKDDFFDAEKYLTSNFGSKDLIEMMKGLRHIRQGWYFPEDKWLSLYAVIGEGCLCALELISPLLLAEHIPLQDDMDSFDIVLWGIYFRNLLKLGTIAPVSVEHLSDLPRRACSQITGTMRDRIAGLLSKAWDALGWYASNEDIARFNFEKYGGYQIEFLDSSAYGILPELMLFALQRNKQCQEVSAKIIWSCLITEYNVTENINESTRQILYGLHEIYHRFAYKPKPSEQESFISQLKATIRLDVEDEMFGDVYDFVHNLSRYMDALNYLLSVPVGPEFNDDRSFHEINCRSYLRDAGKEEVLGNYVSSMYEEYLNSKDYIQAALSLELYSTIYTWDQQTIVPQSYKPKLAQQTSFERKELLYTMIAKNYIKGNSLERAIDAYNGLLDAYHEHTLDLKSFSYVHSKLAKLYLDLESSDKLTPSYFRVEFIGTGFPLYIRGREQIYQGMPFEHITSIYKRLLNIFPGARIISEENEARNAKEKFKNGRFLYVSVVEPVDEISDKVFNTSIGVRQYARNRDLRFFTTMKRLPGYSSVFDLWTEETTYETQLSFPTLMNRSFIKESKTVKLSPLDNAIRTLINKNNDLIQLESKINQALKEKHEVGALTMEMTRQLSGTVDSPVNGGVGQYRDFLSKLDQDEDKLRLLKRALDDLVMILNRCLQLHGKIVTPNLKATHDNMLDQYKKNFKDEIEALTISGELNGVSNSNKIQRMSLIRKDKDPGSPLRQSRTNRSNGSLGTSTTTSSMSGRMSRTNSTTTFNTVRLERVQLFKSAIE
ncbi:dedicator of cytokinesis protein 4 CRK binding protein [Spathaspora passalidarum NRRL Y-27907]|uniref:Dedicator of cytokinesis protein 4 CRK binding protein n=1 Tax=Spathaspora passalidarum (strain NRRL Y-27907 / 11-Y1) TaxID=619300 RepID=G3ALF1_SPAPN|nr:dedicator of cytokinesis protein 4 CRK binding protein [Spathaspora passalidarum NRRL Y-27907]EGW33194.1 dedicator of cytokinesis protein 4 CRK binding protein [Spathaspora passalidarum NRRL Y-27907]